MPGSAAEGSSEVYDTMPVFRKRSIVLMMALITGRSAPEFKLLPRLEKSPVWRKNRASEIPTNDGIVVVVDAATARIGHFHDRNFQKCSTSLAGIKGLTNEEKRITKPPFFRMRSGSRVERLGVK